LSRLELMMKIAALTLSLIVAAGALAQPSPGPVPPEMIRGRTLVVERANFSIELPGEGWQWEQLLNPTHPAPDSLGTYLAVNPQTKAYYIVTLPGGKVDHIDDEFVRGGMAAVRDRSPEAKESLRYGRSDIPIPGSLRYRFEQSYPNVGRQHTYAYTIATGTVVMLLDITPEAEEPADFTRFVKSFRLLRPIAAGGVESFKEPTSTIPGYFAVLLVGAGIAALVNKRKKRRVVNPFVVGSWAVAIVFIADLVFAIVLINTHNIDDPYRQGHLVGGVVVGAVVPLIAGIFLARYESKAGKGTPPQQAA
jgi:hypothetical protein